MGSTGTSRSTRTFAPTYYARTQTKNLSGDEDSYLGAIDYAADKYGFSYEHLKVGENFNPEVGFQSRSDFRRNFASVRVSPRTANHPWIRQYTTEVSLDYITDTRGGLETRDATADFRVQMHNSDFFSVRYSRKYEFLDEPFKIATDVTLPVGGYSFQDTFFNYRFGPQRQVNGFVFGSVGSFCVFR